MTWPCCISSTLCSSCCLCLLKVARLLFPHAGLRLGRTMKHSFLNVPRAGSSLSSPALSLSSHVLPSTPSDVAFTHPCSFPNCTYLQKLYNQVFMVCFCCLSPSPFPDENSRELDHSFHQCIWHTVGAQELLVEKRKEC